MTDSDYKNLKFVFLASLVVIGTATFLYVFYQSSMIFLSALIGLGIAALLDPVVNYINRNGKIPRFAGALFILFFIALLFLVIFYLVGSIIFDQVDSLKENFPEIVNKWEKRWDSLSGEYPRVTKAIRETKPMGLAQTTVGYIGVFLAGLGSAATGLTLAAVIALFTTANSKRYYRAFVSFFPAHRQTEVTSNLHLISVVLRKWFVAQFTDMCAVGALTALGLWAVGVDYWALYGVLAGVLSIIPYVGILITVVTSGAIVAVLQPDKLLWLIGVFVITQQLEGNLILPKIMRDQVQIPASPLIFFMILAGSWLGILGVFIVPPLLAITVAWYQRRNARSGPLSQTGDKELPSPHVSPHVT